jgi:hypothetical protein
MIHKPRSYQKPVSGAQFQRLANLSNIVEQTHPNPQNCALSVSKVFASPPVFGHFSNSANSRKCMLG